MNRLVHEQQRRNQQSRQAWDAFASHRRHVTKLILQAAASDHSRLCVLGSGNCNDVELTRLARHFKEIHLVDLDGESLREGVQRQSPARLPHVFVHGGVDVTGSYSLLAGVPAAPIDAAGSIEVWLSALAKTPELELQKPFDVVVSCCLLSQLLEAVVLTLGEGHPRFLEGVVAVRQQHLRLLLELTRPGGEILLITDFVSSVSAPDLAKIDDAVLPQYAARWINERNFFTGLNPLVLARSIWQVPEGCHHVEAVSLLQPWRWNLGPRFYAVAAIQVKKKRESATPYG